MPLGGFQLKVLRFASLVRTSLFCSGDADLNLGPAGNLPLSYTNSYGPPCTPCPLCSDATVWRAAIKRIKVYNCSDDIDDNITELIMILRTH